jgi:antagonist of KipI
MSLHVLGAGLYTLIVDGGRPHSRSLGVPFGGAADRSALALGNGLVGNPPMTAALEIAFSGPTLRAECDIACVVYGAPFDLTSDSQRLSVGRTFTLRSGESLHVGGTAAGARAYLCIRGGIRAQEVLGSRSSLAPLTAGAVLECQSGVIGTRWIEWAIEAGLGSTVLRFVDGPQADWFDDDALSRRTFTITPSSNRMGLRLAGEPLRLPARELVSEPVCPGTVQVTRDGQCIILGVDGQTIGGYPKIAQVISADVDAIGQLRPGQSIGFQRVSLEEAEAVYRQRQSELHEWLMRLRTTA